MSEAKRLQDFFTAAEVGNVEQIKSILEEDKACIKLRVRKRTVLHVAIHNNQEDVVRVLSKFKELFSMKDGEGCTPLRVAVTKGYVNIVEILIQNDALLYSSNSYRNTALLLLAISENNAGMVNFMEKHEAYSRSQDVNDSCNLLHIALKKDFKPIVQILINYTRLADICSCDSYPDPEFAEEIFNQRLEMFLREECLGTERKKDMGYALQLAVSHGRAYQVKRLIGSGGAHFYTEYYGSFLLHEAAKKRHISVLENLLTKMTDLNAVDCHGCTPLHYVSKVPDRYQNFSEKDFEDSLKIMEILLQNGAFVHVFDRHGKTPLHYAVEEKEFRPERIRLLFDYTAEVNAHLEGKPTPIFFANCGAIVQMLIDKGANVNYRISDSSFKSPLHYAIEEYGVTKVEILLENGAKTDNSSFTISLNKGAIETIETIAEGIDVTTVINKLHENPDMYRNLILILAKKHFQGEHTINSQEFLSPSFMWFSMFKKCLEELERMRDVHILSLNLLDILTMPIQKLKSYATKEEVLDFFESNTLEVKFPMYADMIMRRFRKAKKERNLIDSSSEVLKKFVFRLHKINLPDLVVYRIIMDMLHMMDLKKLVEL